MIALAYFAGMYGEIQGPSKRSEANCRGMKKSDEMMNIARDETGYELQESDRRGLGREGENQIAVNTRLALKRALTRNYGAST